jgi:branched-chain amino acid transport system permease protein
MHEVWDRWDRVAERLPWLRRSLAVAGPALAILLLQVVFFPLESQNGSSGALWGIYMLGIILGLLNALVAVGMALVYRSNRILNFAQGDLGTVPTILAVNLVVLSGIPYLLGLLTGVASAIVLGGLVEFLIIRRFFRASRLILTVATIGLSQLLAVCGLLIPNIWGKTPTSLQIHAPFTVDFTLSPIIFHAESVLALIVAPLALVGVALFLRFTSVGMAVRASAERGDRASLLGIPVKGLQTLVWALAALLSFIGLFLRAGIVGLPVLNLLSFGALLFALAALMLGRLTNLPAIALSAVALGILEQAVVWNNPRSPELVYPVVAGVVLVALFLRRKTSTRLDADGASTWQTADEVRSIPPELRHLPEVRAVVWGTGILITAFLVALPALPYFSTHQSDLRKAGVVAVFSIIVLSIVVLTGWAGQVSLGQMAFAAVGGAVGALAAVEWNLDLALALPLCGICGAVVAMIVGVPALRLRGLFLAVSTLAFALAVSYYLLNSKHFSWIPRDRFARSDLFGVIKLENNDRAMYWVCVGALAITLLVLRGIRHSRTGRVLLAQRENERGALSFGISVTRAKLTAFAISGFFAAMAGCLLVQFQQQYTDALFSPAESFNVFTSAVVGGLGSMAGAVIGALYLWGGKWWLQNPSFPPLLYLLPSALGVLVVLLVLPGGLAGLVYRLRDRWLRWVAARHDLVVPSLIADVRVDDHAVEHAEEGVESADEPLATTAGAPG